jgi:hypothetical protein
MLAYERQVYNQPTCLALRSVEASCIYIGPHTVTAVRVEADSLLWNTELTHQVKVMLCSSVPEEKTDIKIVPWACPKQSYMKRWKIVFFQHLQQLISLQGQSGQIVDFILGSINKIFL